MAWFLYMALCSDKSIYTGITTNVQKRFEKHRSGAGARYTKAHPIQKILYTEKYKTRSAASKREAEIKNWPRKKKLALVSWIK